MRFSFQTKPLIIFFNGICVFFFHRAFLTKNVSSLLPTVIYTYLRIIVDHSTPGLARLRQRESEFITGLLRSNVSKQMFCTFDN